MQWMPGLCFFLLLATLILGLIKLGTSATIASPACISIVWIVYALIPEALVMYYACVSKACALSAGPVTAWPTVEVSCCYGWEWWGNSER